MVQRLWADPEFVSKVNLSTARGDTTSDVSYESFGKDRAAIAFTARVGAVREAVAHVRFVAVSAQMPRVTHGRLPQLWQTSSPSAISPTCNR